MRRTKLRSEDPMRMTLALMLLALLLPLGVMIWLLQKSVIAERQLVQDELIAAHRAQLSSLVADISQQWKLFLQEPFERDLSASTIYSWKKKGGIAAYLIIDASGQLRHPVQDDAATTQSLLANDEANSSDAISRFRTEVLDPLQLRNTQGSSTDSLQELERSIQKFADATLEQDMPDNTRIGLLRLLLRITELSSVEDTWFVTLLDFWEEVFSGESAASIVLNHRQSGFFSKRLLEMDTPLPKELRNILEDAIRTSRLQEDLLLFYHSHSWKEEDAHDQRRYVLLSQQLFDGLPVVSVINRTPNGIAILQVKETCMELWVAPIWKKQSSENPLWIRVFNPSGKRIYDSSVSDADSVIQLDFPLPLLQWRLEAGFTDDTLLSQTSRRQTAFTIYAGITLVILIGSAGALALHQLNHQIRLNRLKNDFIGMVSHELRTPLASMRMLVDTLIEGRYKDESTLQDYLAMLAGENERLSRLVDKFLTFSRMQRGKTHFELREVAPAKIVSAALAATRAHWDSSNVELSVDVPPDLPDIHADEDGMVTVLINHLENAYKYSDAQKKIRLSVWAKDERVCFQVSDNGIGIPPKEQRAVFKEFYQIDNHLSRRADGSGLGLSINRHIVRAHGGKIELTSEEGKGSTFSIWIPVKPV